MPGRDVSSRGLQLAIHAALATFENLVCANQSIRHTTFPIFLPEPCVHLGVLVRDM